MRASLMETSFLVDVLIKCQYITHRRPFYWTTELTFHRFTKGSIKASAGLTSCTSLLQVLAAASEEQAAEDVPTAGSARPRTVRKPPADWPLSQKA